VRGMDEGQLTIKSIGHQLYFMNRGVLHAISPVEKRILWSKTVGDHTDGVGSGRHSSRPVVSAMVAPGANDGGQSLLLQKAHSTGSLAVVQPNYLCMYGRRSLSILDPRTGEQLWELDGLSMNAVVVGTRDVLFAIHPGKEEASVYRALDGKPLEIAGAAKLLNNALSTHGSSLLLLEQDGANPLKTIGIRRAKVLLRLHDPVTNSTKWKLELPPRTFVSPLDSNEVVALRNDGQVQRIDVATGRTTAMEAISIEKSGLQREKYLLADDDRIYMIVNSSDTGHQSYGENLASIRINGTVHAWNRHDNRLIWNREIKHQNLVVDRFSTLPVLLCVSRSWKQRARANLGIGTLNITAVHKQTGELLIDKEIPSAYSGFHAISFNAEEPSIDLKSFNMRLRLVPIDSPVAVAPVPKSAEKAN
jgi:outer membrane protein assembly factor BamB